MKLSIANLKRHYVVGYADKLEEFIKALEKKFPDFFRGASETYDRMKLERIEEKKNIKDANVRNGPLPWDRTIRTTAIRHRCAMGLGPITEMMRGHPAGYGE